MSETERGSLKATHRAAERRRAAIESGAVRYSPADPDAYGDAVRTAIEAYERCDRLVAQLALFSTNESAEDIATAHLPYLLVPFYIAELALKIPAYSSTSTPASRPAERRAVLKRARDAYERFLHQLEGYGLLAANYVRLLHAYTEDPSAFSTVGSVSGSSTGTGGGGARGSNPQAGLVGLADPAARRNAKIANFQAEKELRGKLDVLKQRQQQRRELKRRRRLRIQEEEGGSSEGKTNSDDTGEAEEDEEEDDEDEEEARKLYLAQIYYCVHMAFQGLDGINVEDDMLANAPAPREPERGGSGSTAGGLGDNRQRSAAAAAARDDSLSARIDRLNLQHNGGASLQALGAGAPTWAGARGGPLLSKEGRPKQPFTITAGSNLGIGNNRAQMAKNVFRPGHNLPTMSIDEYLEEERRRGNIIEGGGPSSGLAPEPDEDNYDKADAETMKARAWDEFTEANAKGSGNTLNRG